MDYMKYFKRTDIVKIFEEVCKTECIHPEKQSCNSCMVREIFDSIDELPAADVVERNALQHAQSVSQHTQCVESVKNALDVPERNVGKWEIDEVVPRRYGCSNCKRIVGHIENFCPNCGARMTE